MYIYCLLEVKCIPSPAVNIPPVFCSISKLISNLHHCIGVISKLSSNSYKIPQTASINTINIYNFNLHDQQDYVYGEPDIPCNQCTRKKRHLRASSKFMPEEKFLKIVSVFSR